MPLAPTASAVVALLLAMWRPVATRLRNQSSAAAASSHAAAKTFLSPHSIMPSVLLALRARALALPPAASAADKAAAFNTLADVRFPAKKRIL